VAISFIVMTWNVENLFPAGHSSGPATPEIYEQKMRNLSMTILGIAPDILALQEVGDPECFADLQRRLGDRYPYTLLSSHPDLRGIRVGLMSRLPLVQAREFYEFPQGSLTNVTDSDGDVIRNMGRGAIKATVVVAPGLLVNIITAHLKSKLVTYANGRRSPRDENERARETGVAEFKRTAEAVALRVYMNPLLANNDNPLVLMGDLNDGPEATSTQILLGPEDRSLEHRDKFDDIRLYNLVDYIAPERKFSRLYHKQRELIDHIAVSYELVFRRRQVDSYIEPIESIDQGTEVRREATFPDHAPIYARFEIPEATSSGPAPAPVPPPRSTPV
jgi:endonuclease/exonuclease/phosphatase family metal-dependent hydrolase